MIEEKDIPQISRASADEILDLANETRGKDRNAEVVNIRSARKLRVPTQTTFDVRIVDDCDDSTQRIFVPGPPEGNDGWGFTADEARSLAKMLVDFADELDPHRPF